MKRFLILFIFLVSAAVVEAQWSENPIEKRGCSHAKSIASKAIFSPEYNWQSLYLFDYDVSSYIIDIEVSDTTTYIGGSATINCIAIVPIDTFAFELISEYIIDQILINGIEYSNYFLDGDNVLVPIAEVLEGTAISAQISYHGKPPSTGFFSGVTNDSSTYWQKSVTWTLSEPFAAKYWFPVKQVLQDKADSAWIFLTTASANMVGSEGLLTDVVDLGNGKLRYEWKTKYPIDYYLLSFAVAEYQDYSVYAHPAEMEDDSLLIQNFIYDSPGNLEDKKIK